jgi:L-ectoine synthase
VVIKIIKRREKKMIIRTLSEALKSERRVVTDKFQSVMLILKNDQMGFSFNVTTIFAGAELHMHYTNHLESCYCISGKGTIEDVKTRRVYDIVPGTIYILNDHDKHILKCTEEMVLMTVFNPPLNGKEVHDSSGAYRLDAEAVGG